jgi:hypothetical protein
MHLSVITTIGDNGVYNLKPLISGNLLEDRKNSSVCIKDTIEPPTSNIVILPPSLKFMTNEEVSYWDDAWNERYYSKYRKDYLYSEHRKVAEKIIAFSNQSSVKKNDMNQNDYCFESKLPKNKNGYRSITDKFLSIELPNQGITLNSLMARSASRVVTMASYPEIDWNSWIDDETVGWEGHHRCFDPACINPHHLVPMRKSNHLVLHKRLEDLVIQKIVNTITPKPTI